MGNKSVDNLTTLNSEEVYSLYKTNKAIVSELTNEMIVNMIQCGYEEFWDILYNKTKNSIHKVFHKKVHHFYKSTMEEDVYSVLEYGWTKAVLTYDDKKATAPFIAYASYLMFQQYQMLIRKMSPDRIGRSVRHDYLDGFAVSNVRGNGTQEVHLNVHGNCNSYGNDLPSVILKDKNNIFSNIDNKILLEKALLALKEEKEDLYDLIILHYIQGIPQTKIAQIQNHGQSYISRKIKKGIKFLHDYLLIKSKGDIEELKIELLSSFK